MCNVRTFIMVTFDTVTNFPAVRWNSLLAVAMMNIRHRWNGMGVPTQSHPNAASLTLSAWNRKRESFKRILAVPYYIHDSSCFASKPYCPIFTMWYFSQVSNFMNYIWVLRLYGYHTLCFTWCFQIKLSVTRREFSYYIHHICKFLLRSLHV
jgi:hypothetical protein